MVKVALLTLHGMGVTPVKYADSLLSKLRARMGAHYAKVEVESAYYQNILQDNQEKVWRNVEEKGKVRFDDLRRFLLFGFADAAGLENGKEVENSVYEQAQMRIARSLLKLYERAPDMPLVYISHSLGCQVLSSFLYDAQKHERGEYVGAGIWKPANPFIDSLSPDQRRYLQGATAMGWISTGCNIPIFVAAHERMAIKPIRKPTEHFHWLNLYDPDDALGWPLQPLSDDYEALVEDRAINAGQGILEVLGKSWNPMAHTAYWTDDDVVRPLSLMLSRLVS